MASPSSRVASDEHDGTLTRTRASSNTTMQSNDGTLTRRKSTSSANISSNNSTLTRQHTAPATLTANDTAVERNQKSATLPVMKQELMPPLEPKRKSLKEAIRQNSQSADKSNEKSKFSRNKGKKGPPPPIPPRCASRYRTMAQKDRPATLHVVTHKKTPPTYADGMEILRRMQLPITPPYKTGGDGRVPQCLQGTHPIDTNPSPIFQRSTAQRAPAERLAARHANKSNTKSQSTNSLNSNKPLIQRLPLANVTTNQSLDSETGSTEALSCPPTPTRQCKLKRSSNFKLDARSLSLEEKKVLFGKYFGESRLQKSVSANPVRTHSSNEDDNSFCKVKSLGSSPEVNTVTEQLPLIRPASMDWTYIQNHIRRCAELNKSECYFV